MIEVSLQKKLSGPSGEMNLDVSFTLAPGQLLTLYGPSGAGKTSILRMIAGLLQPDKGLLKTPQSTWMDTSRQILLSPQKRKVGFVFQDYALFPNMTVFENLSYALSAGGDAGTIEELIEIVSLGDLRDRRPATLSGGQQQRVALARAIVQKPDLLLLDEPLSALDQEMRHSLQQYILQVHKEYNLSTILVSHDASEIFRMSDEMIVLEKGKIIRQGRPVDVFSHREVSGKFQFTGEIIKVEKQGFLYIVSILIGKDLVRVIADEGEGRDLHPGDKVLVASKAFNPIIKKLMH